MALFLQMTIIFMLSSTPVQDQGPPVTDAHRFVLRASTLVTGDPVVSAEAAATLGHVSLFALLGALALLALSSLVLPYGPRWQAGRTIWRWALHVSLVLIVCYGLSDEWHQNLVPGRTPSILDAAWDAVGGAFGAVVALQVRSTTTRDAELRSWATLSAS